MRKGIRIFLGILGGITAAGFLFWLFFPGLPAYLAVNRICTYRDTVLQDYPFEEKGTPADWVPVAEDGLQLSLPASVKKVERDGLEKLSVKIYANTDVAEGENADPKVVFMDNSDLPKMEFIGENGFTQEQFDRGMRGIRTEKPENNYEFWRILYDVTPKDYNFHKHGTWRFYYQLMQMKEEMYPAIGGSGYHFETENAKGFVLNYGKPERANEYYALLIELYDKNDLDRRCSAIVKSKDETMLHQIANSAQIVPEQGA